MAVSLKTKSFASALELTAWAADAGNTVITIVAIIFDVGSGKHVLYYKET